MGSQGSRTACKLDSSTGEFEEVGIESTGASGLIMEQSRRDGGSQRNRVIEFSQSTMSSCNVWTQSAPFVCVLSNLNPQYPFTLLLFCCF